MEFLQVLADSCTISGGEVDASLTTLVETIINAIKIVVPILLVVWGMLDLGKAGIAQKEDDIKKGQQTFFKRVIAAVIVFFIPAVVKLIVGMVTGDDAKGILECLEEVL